MSHHVDEMHRNHAGCPALFAVAANSSQVMAIADPHADDPRVPRTRSMASSVCLTADDLTEAELTVDQQHGPLDLG